MQRLSASIFLSFATLLSAWSAQSELVLTTGEIVRGEILSETEDVIVLNRTIESRGKTMTAKISYLKTKIAKIARDLPAEKDPLADYKQHVLTKGDDLADHLALIRWCRDHRLVPLAVDHLNIALARGPGNPEALRHAAELGCLEVDGRWMLESDFAASQGTDAETDARKAANREKTKAVVSANQADKAYTEARKRLDKATARSEAIPLELNEARNEVARARSDVTTAESDERYAREEATRNQGSMNDAQRTTNEESMKYYREALAKAERRQGAARQQRKAAQVKQQAAEKRVAALEAERLQIDKTIAALTESQEALRLRAEEAKAQREMATQTP